MRSEFTPTLPTHITLETTTICNLKCPMCTISLGRPSVRPYYLSEDIVRKLSPAIKISKSLQFSGIGEPLLSQSLFKCLELIPPDCYSHFNSNFLLLTPEICQKLIESNLTEINISMDAGTESTYKKIRSNDFKKLIDNIILFHKMRKDMKKDYPLLTNNMTLMRSNIDELCEFIDLSISMGIFSSSTWPLNDFGKEGNSELNTETYNYTSELPYEFKDYYNKKINEAKLYAESKHYKFHYILI